MVEEVIDQFLDEIASSSKKTELALLRYKDVVRSHGFKYSGHVDSEYGSGHLFKHPYKNATVHLLPSGTGYWRWKHTGTDGHVVDNAGAGSLDGLLRATASK